MAYRQLTEEGKSFIRKICEGNGNSLLSGKSRFKIKDPTNKLYNPNGVLPYCTPETPATKIWTSNAKYEGSLITTNAALGEALIKWYDKYGKIYEMDANVLAAQAFQESGYYIWNYALTSTASGISQFTADTLWGIIINNNHPNITPLFTDDEINAIANNITDNKFDKNSYTVKSDSNGRKNRAIIHQNVIDNPEIMIKAQFRYMKYIANKCDGLASSTLLGYSRGDGLATKSYAESINKVINYGVKKEMDEYEKEGIDYVFKIFALLGDKNNELTSSKPQGYYFGYDKGTLDLKMRSGVVFDAQTALAIDSNVRYQ
jgi:hypothetical protein